MLEERSTRRRLLLLAVAVFGVMAAAPAASVAQGPGQDSVTGQATYSGIPPGGCRGYPPGSTCPLSELRLDARSEPDGSEATGTASLALLTGELGRGEHNSGTVTCLAAAGNTATVGFLGQHVDSGLLIYPVAMVLRVVDGGGPASGLDAWELLAVRRGDPFDPSAPPPPAFTDCAAYLPQAPGTRFVNTAGDVIVVDAPALPRSKEECKEGGWRRFGTRFRNQGQCVSFVTARGRDLH
jgi:hypothetical protein